MSQCYATREYRQLFLFYFFGYCSIFISSYVSKSAFIKPFEYKFNIIISLDLLVLIGHNYLQLDPPYFRLK